MNYFPKPKGHVRDEVNGRHHFEDGQLRDGRERVRVQRERAGATPHAFQPNVFEVVFDELTNPRAAVHMRDDLEQEMGAFSSPKVKSASASLCLYPIVPVATRMGP